MNSHVLPTRALLLLVMMASSIVLIIDNGVNGMCPGSCKQKSLRDISNDFTLKLLKVILENEKKCSSLIVSTFNIEQVMYEITNAACGQTLNELERYFEICDLKQVNNEFKNYSQQIQISLTSGDGKTEALVRLFSGIFVQPGFPVKGSYVNLLHNYYEAIARNLDFAKQPEQSKNTLNEYISNATNGLFPQFFSAPLPTNTVILQLAVIYFYSQWPRNYFRFDSTKRNFYQNCKNTVQAAQYINNHDARESAGYAELFGFKIASIPYIEADYSIVLLLPLQASQDPGTLFQSLDSAKIAQILDATDTQSECKRGGVESLYERADLCAGVDQSQISGNLAVSQTTHQAYIDLNQNGTTAAAVTAIGITVTSIRFCENPKQFYANRPFVFAIKHNKLKIFLFIGICYSPDYPISQY